MPRRNSACGNAGRNSTSARAEQLHSCFSSPGETQGKDGRQQSFDKSCGNCLHRLKTLTVSREHGDSASCLRLTLRAEKWTYSQTHRKADFATMNRVPQPPKLTDFQKPEDLLGL